MTTFTKRSVQKWLATPAIIRTPGLLMPVRPLKEAKAPLMTIENKLVTMIDDALRTYIGKTVTPTTPEEMAATIARFLFGGPGFIYTPPPCLIAVLDTPGSDPFYIPDPESQHT